jgi:hypothetical protein
VVQTVLEYFAAPLLYLGGFYVFPGYNAGILPFIFHSGSRQHVVSCLCVHQKSGSHADILIFLLTDNYMNFAMFSGIKCKYKQYQNTELLAYFFFFYSIHRLVYRRQETTTFRRLDLSPSSGGWGKIDLLSWAR